MIRYWVIAIIVFTSNARADDARVYISSTPNGAVLTVDGASRGKTPVEIRAPIGKRIHIDMRRKGYVHESQDLLVEHDVESVRVPLRKLRKGVKSKDVEPSIPKIPNRNET